MPLDRVSTAGNDVVAMASVALQHNYALTGGVAATTFTENELAVGGLPSLTYWVRLNNAAANVVFTPVFSVMNTTTSGVTAPDWLPFTNGAILVPGNVFVFTVRAAVAKAAIQVTVPPATAIDIDVVISAGG